jgi:BirA family transcriptional regulator, biotin operon repressor / biotin---[acetyl-CoA-carboxylase] ligase
VSRRAAAAGDRPETPLGHPRVPGETLGRPRVHLRRTDSTNERARELALAGAPHGTLVTAAEQTAGRGRQGRRWSAPAGSALLMSLLLRAEPTDHGEELAPLLPLIAALAVSDVAGDEARIKWPNDVVVERGVDPAKLAGILTEGRPQEGWAIVGIGLNVAVRIDQLPAELRDSAATLGRPAGEIEPTLERLLDAFGRRLAEPPEMTLRAWRARDVLLGRPVTWNGGAGEAEGIDGAGRLVVALDGGGRVTLDAGEVHLGREANR